MKIRMFFYNCIVLKFQSKKLKKANQIEVNLSNSFTYNLTYHIICYWLRSWCSPLIVLLSSRGLFYITLKNNLVDHVNNSVGSRKVGVNYFSISNIDCFWKKKTKTHLFIFEWNNVRLIDEWNILAVTETATVPPDNTETAPEERPRLYTVPDTTWVSSNFFKSSGLANNLSKAPAGSAWKAALVGANNVNGPSVISI